jgi:hypothetical protein
MGTLEHCPKVKGGRFPNKFRKPQICELKFFFDLRTFCANLQICDLQVIYFLRFADLWFCDFFDIRNLKIYILEAYQFGSGSETLSCSLQVCGLQFSDWDTKEIC